MKRQRCWCPGACRETAPHTGQPHTTLSGGAFVRWRMDAWCIGSKCGVISQVVWLSMCEHGRCVCSDIRQMAHALG
eukprot:1178004-Pleurochrysis_carterae.AAC.3